MRASKVWTAQASALAMVFALSACGEGSGGGGGVVSTPTYTKIADLTGNQTFQTAGVQYNVAAPAGGFTNGSTQAFGSGVTVAYTEATDSYKLTAADGTTATFDPSNVFIPPTPAPNSQIYIKTVGTTRDQLTLTAPTTASGVALSYTIVGTWGHIDTATGQATYRLAVGGVPTQSGDMPRTGSANYETGVGGAAAQGGNNYSLNGHSTATFRADFAANSVTTSLTLGGTVNGGAVVTPLGVFNGTGTISSSGPGFQGTLAGTAGTGAFAGAFFGPQAKEMGFNYYLNGTGFSAVGIATGVKQ